MSLIFHKSPYEIEVKCWCSTFEGWVLLEFLKVAGTIRCLFNACFLALSLLSFSLCSIWGGILPSFDYFLDNSSICLKKKKILEQMTDVYWRQSVFYVRDTCAARLRWKQTQSLKMILTSKASCRSPPKLLKAIDNSQLVEKPLPTSG